MGVSSALGSSALLPAGLGFRNLIINGDMRIDQRNAGASFTSVDGGFGPDRWCYGATQASKTTTQRITSTIPGFAHSMRITSTSAYTPVSNDEIEWFQRIEASQIAQLGWGTTSPKNAVVSFWVKSSITGAFGGSVSDSALGYSFPFLYTINAANTAEYKSITITPPSAGTWTSTGVGRGMHLFFSLGAAGTSLGTAGAWTAGFKNGATGQTNLVATNGATLEITGVQLEANYQPTPFEQRPIGTELALCQRYFSKCFPIDTAPTNSGGTGATSGNYLVVWQPTVSNSYTASIPFKVTMRRNPDITFYNAENANANTWSIYNSASALNSAYAVVAGGYSQSHFFVYATGVSTVTVSNGFWTANAEL